MSKRIHINDVLAQISATDENQGATFQHSWVRSSGPKKGSIKTVARVRRGLSKEAREMTARKRSQQKDNKPRALHIDRDTIPLVDAETGQYLTPLISHIIQFNLQKVYH